MTTRMSQRGSTQDALNEHPLLSNDIESNSSKIADTPSPRVLRSYRHRKVRLPARKVTSSSMASSSGQICERRGAATMPGISFVFISVTRRVIHKRRVRLKKACMA